MTLYFPHQFTDVIPDLSHFQTVPPLQLLVISAIWTTHTDISKAAQISCLQNASQIMQALQGGRPDRSTRVEFELTGFPDHWEILASSSDILKLNAELK
jgi:hypothetical protein